MKVTIRPLEEEDALTSYKWRNDPEVWKHTLNQPNKKITIDIERKWLKEAIKRENEKRFAICVDAENKYIGNVQLTDITSSTAQFHIFIGERSYHGNKIGTRATQLLLKYAFEVLQLQTVYLEVLEDNFAAIKAYENCGFIIENRNGKSIRMLVKRNDFVKGFKEEKQ